MTGNVCGREQVGFFMGRRRIGDRIQCLPFALGFYSFGNFRPHSFVDFEVN